MKRPAGVVKITSLPGTSLSRSKKGRLKVVRWPGKTVLPTWPGKPLPGQVGNTVFPGHRTTYSRPFWDLDKLVPGNEVIFTTPAGRFTYQVTGTTIVAAKDTYVVDNTPDATFTLLACHPKGSAKQRIVVKGRMVGQPVVAPPPPPPSNPSAPVAPPTTVPRRGLLGLF